MWNYSRLFEHVQGRLLSLPVGPDRIPVEGASRTKNRPSEPRLN